MATGMSIRRMKTIILSMHELSLNLDAVLDFSEVFSQYVDPQLRK